MADMTNDIETTCVVCRIAVRYSYIMFPLDIRDLMAKCMQFNYEPLIQLPPPAPLEPLGRKISLKGPILGKGDSFIDVNYEKQVLGVSARSPLSSLQAFGEVVGNMSDTLDETKVVLYEFQTHYKARSQKKCSEYLSKQGETMPLRSKVKKIFGFDVITNSIKLTSNEGDSDTSNYFEISIQPAISSEGDVLEIQAVYRVPDRKEFEHYVSLFDTDLHSLIAQLVK